MQVSSQATHNARAYDAKPWLAQYPPDVPHSISYPNQSVWEVLEDVVRRQHDETAFVFQNYPMSFAQLLKHSEHMSGALYRAGVRRGDVVLGLLPNVPHFPVTYYGTLRLGAALAAVPPTSVEPEIQSYLEDTGARTIVTVDLLYEKIAGLIHRPNIEQVLVGSVTDFMPAWVRLAAPFLDRVPKPKEPIPYGGKVRKLRSFLRLGRHVHLAEVGQPDDVALLQYTGGTTGLPKAAMLTQASLLTNARQMVCWFPALSQGRQTLLAALPFFHVYGVTLALNAGLLLGARTILIPRPAVGEILEAIKRFRPGIFPGVPALYIALINDGRSKSFDLSSVDICVSGGAPLPIEVKRDFEALTGGHLYEGYGLSEASPVTHAQPYDHTSAGGGIGVPLPDTSARIVNEADEPVPVGQEGELVIRGPQVMQGYWRRTEETQQALKGGWLHTGDVARMDENGFFTIVDRKKDLIITGGENIYPREVEEVLFQHPGVKEAAVVGIPHPYGGEIAKAFVVLKPGETATKKDITRFAAERLAKHKVPRAVEFRQELPKSQAGKVLRRILAEEERARAPRRRGGLPDQSDSDGGVPSA